MDIGQNMTFFEGRMEILMEQIRDAIYDNATQTKELADAVKKLANCVNDKYTVPSMNIKNTD